MPKKHTPKAVQPKEPWVEALRTGTHTSMKKQTYEFSESSLREIESKVKEQLKSGFEPPVVKGHPKHDDPREASISDVKVEGDKLLLKVSDVSPEFAEQCQEGKYKYVSVALYNDLSLRHLGVLGGMNPAVKGLAPIQFAEYEDEGLCFADDKGDYEVFAEPSAFPSVFSEAAGSLSWRFDSLAGFFRRFREMLIADKGIDEANKVISEYTIKDVEEIPRILQDAARKSDQATTGGSEFGEHVPGVSGQESDSKAVDVQAEAAELEETRRKLRAAEEKLAQNELDKEKAEFAEFLTGLEKEGRLLPAQRPTLEKLFGTVAKGTQGMEFGEGDDHPTQLLRATLSALPVQVQIGGELKPQELKTNTVRKIQDYKQSEEKNGRQMTFAEAAEELTQQRSFHA